MGVNKVVYGDRTLIDISDSTVTSSDLLDGEVAYDNSGKRIVGGITKRTSSDLSASGATVTVPSGYYASQQTKSVTTQTQATPSIEVSSGGLITASATQSAGYVSAGTKSSTKQLATLSARTITPTKSGQQAIASGVYTTGIITVGAIPSNYIIPSGNKEITENGTNIDVATFSTVSVNVPTSGGGSSSAMNVQAYIGYQSISSTSYTATNVKLTVAKTGTYRVSWMGWRSTNSGTSGSQLYINNSAYGSANTTFTNTYGQAVTLTNVSLTQGQEIVIRARSRSTSYVMAVGNLIIEQTA